MLGHSSGNHDWLLATQALVFLAVFIYATHATQAIAFGWKPGLTRCAGTCTDDYKLAVQCSKTEAILWFGSKSNLAQLNKRDR